jgi:ElaB/YqjD/DUF883 family membrane-anchored ribosome-binding protein
MATSTQTRSRKTSNGTSHATQALQSMSRRTAKRGRQLSAELSRESAALTRRAGALLGSAVQSTRRHPWIALGTVAALGALLGGAFWYRRH